MATRISRRRRAVATTDHWHEEQDSSSHWAAWIASSPGRRSTAADTRRPSSSATDRSTSLPSSPPRLYEICGNFCRAISTYKRAISTSASYRETHCIYPLCCTQMWTPRLAVDRRKYCQRDSSDDDSAILTELTRTTDTRREKP